MGLEKINHYLAPIVDEFLDLWKGWRIPKTYEHPDGLDIKGALIIGSSDTPTTRKLFGHASAVMKCYKYENVVLTVMNIVKPIMEEWKITMNG